MSRPMMFGIVFCCFFAQVPSVGWGQDYLELPENEPTLTDRFKSLKDKFRLGSSPVKQAESRSKQRSNPRPPRYRGNSRSSQAQQNRNASTQPLPAMKVPSRPRKSLPSAAPSLTRRSQGLPRGLSAKATPLLLGAKPEQTVRAKSQPATQRTAPQRIARKSPPSSRSSELDAALADLLHTQPAGRSKAATFSLKGPARTTRNPLQPALPLRKNTFDLRKALLDDAEDSFAAEVAAAVVEKAEAAQEAKVARGKITSPQAKQSVRVKQPAKKLQIEVGPLEAEQPKVKSTPPLPSVTKTPAIMKPGVMKPNAMKPGVIANDIIANDIIAPEVLAPNLVKPTTKPVTTDPVAAKVALQEGGSSSPVRAEVVNDPFESSVVKKRLQEKSPRQAFSDSPKLNSRPSPRLSDKPSGNSMRSTQSARAPARNVIKQAIVKKHPLSQQKIWQTSQQPVIVSHVEGPPSILVGREATYQITLENTSDETAKDLRTEISVPEWAELVDAMSTSGVVEQSSNGTQVGTLEWRLSELLGNKKQSLRLRLVPHSGRPLQLGVRWSQAPAQSQAIVEVQEPKLELLISGPQEVRFGKPQRYRLTLRNPGTGSTEEVVLRLIPPGGDVHSASTQQIGNLKPGEVRDIDLELTAREAGELLIQADATADGGLKVATTKTVLCRKPELKVDWRGPDKKYAGTVAAYYFRLRNPGTATTEPVDMSLKLPSGTEFVSASDGHSFNTSTGVVSWRLAGIDVGEEQFMQVRCKIARPGLNKFQLIAKTNDGELKDSKDFHTKVIALADLKLEVTDPQGPLPIGESVLYEIRVRNRGTTAAENINIVGLFSEGIDPITIEGAQFTVRDGRVSFHPIKNLPAGREVLLRIHAQANQVGTHVFRTEVTCAELEIKLAAEETTRFFQDEYRWKDGETAYSAERSTNASTITE